MSYRVAAKVRARRVGSLLRKAVLICCAEKASDDGSGIWASKVTIAAEVEAHRITVVKAVNELVRDGLLVPVGTRRYRSGATVTEYRINLAAVEALPPVKLPSPVAENNTPLLPSATPPVAEDNTAPLQSTTQTVHRTILEKGGGSARARVPPDFPIEDLRRQVVGSLGFDPLNAPRWWRPPTATHHLHRWLAELDLTPEEVLHVVAEEQKRHAAPPSGPRAFDGAMQDYATERTAPLAPRRSRPPKAERPEDFMAQIRAEWEAKNK